MEGGEGDDLKTSLALFVSGFVGGGLDEKSREAGERFRARLRMECLARASVGDSERCRGWDRTAVLWQPLLALQDVEGPAGVPAAGCNLAGLGRYRLGNRRCSLADQGPLPTALPRKLPFTNFSPYDNGLGLTL